MTPAEIQKKIRAVIKDLDETEKRLDDGFSPAVQERWKAAMVIVAELIQLGHMPGVVYKKYPCPKGLTSGCIGREACYGEKHE